MSKFILFISSIFLLMPVDSEWHFRKFDIDILPEIKHFSCSLRKKGLFFCFVQKSGIIQSVWLNKVTYVRLLFK